MVLSDGDSALSWSMACVVSAPLLRACRQAKPLLSLPQTSLPCLAPLFGALCPPEQLKWNARPHSPLDLSVGPSVWCPGLWPGSPADRGGSHRTVRSTAKPCSGACIARAGQSQLLCCGITVPFLWAAAVGSRAVLPQSCLMD